MFCADACRPRTAGAIAATARFVKNARLDGKDMIGAFGMLLLREGWIRLDLANLKNMPLFVCGNQ